MTVPRWLALALAWACAGGACSTEDTVGVRSCPPGEACGGGDDLDSYCDGEGPPVLVNDVCTGDLAEETFSFALCTCSDLDTTGELVTDSFDSRTGPYDTGQPGGSVGVNGKAQLNAPLDVGASLIVAGAAGITAGGRVDVAGDLACGGPLGDPQAQVGAGGDARVGGDVEVADLVVGGALTLPAGAALSVTGTLDVGAETRAPVAVAPPCECNPSDTVDIGGIIADHLAANHNAAIGLDADALADLGDAPARLELPCGRFYLSRIQGAGDVTIAVSGRTALFVGENITLDRNFTVEVAPDAELDLFVAGFINIAGIVEVGSAARPSKARMYVGGAGSIALSAGSTLRGNLYAPLADLALSGGGEFFGAVFVNRLVASAPVSIHYDRAVQAAADNCIR